MQPRQGQLSRADLLEVLVKADVYSSQAVAAQLDLTSDFSRVSVGDAAEPIADDATVTHLEGNKASGSERALATSLPREPFWVCVGREVLQAEDLPKPDPQALPSLSVWPDRPTKPPLWHPLNSLRELLPRLLAQLGAVFPGRELDVDAVVKAISRGQPLRRLPRKPRRTLGQHIQFIDDRHGHLTPFWRDQQLLQGGLEQFLPEYGISSAVLPDGSSQPRSLVGRYLQEWQLPDAHGIAFILSDLGALSTQPQRAVSIWLEIVQQLHRQQCKIIALVPCHPDDCDPRFKAMVDIVPWLPLRQLSNRVVSHWEQHTETLLTLLAPAIRLEPGLIRQMRLAYAGIQPTEAMPPAIEAWLWQHPALAEHHSTAASWHTETRLHYLAQFAGLAQAHKQLALDVIRQWRGRLSEQVWFEEIIELDAGSQALIADDLQAAVVYFRQMERAYRLDAEYLADVDQAWLRRVLQRLPEHVWQDATIGQCFQRFKYALHEGEQVTQVDPRQLPPTAKPQRQVELCQRGHTLQLLAFDPQQARPQGFSPLCLFTLRHPHVQIQQGGKRLAELRLDVQDAFTLPGLDGFELVSDCERLTFQPWYRPDVFESAGQDEFGLFADLVLPQPFPERSRREHLTQRFRYTPPQTFLMGSPKDEPGRYDDETQHSVTLTQGYWLADTTITQVFWEAIMGNNPSHFQGAQRPVEKVSWDDTQTFIQKLQQHWQLLDVRLPLEAEWECACRAGTTSAFSFGGKDDLNTKKVNYSGDWDNWKSGGETKPIKSYPPNEWGLYEMHGNVFEWCQDAWQATLPAEPVTDPDGAGGDTGQRVVRGGSWGNEGRRCRSAYRDWRTPDRRYNSLGFRLVLGHSVIGEEYIHLTKFENEQNDTIATEKTIKLFISYSHADEAHKERLEKHLKVISRTLPLTAWSDRHLLAGESVDEQIFQQLNIADIVLLLVSPDFIDSYYCSREMEQALERYEKAGNVVIPVIIRHTANWHNHAIGQFVALPKDGKPLAKWEDKDEFWASVENGIRVQVERLINE